MPSIPRMYSITLFFIAGTGYRSENMPSIPRMYSIALFFIAGAGYRSENMPSIPRMYSIALFFIAGAGYRSENMPSIPRMYGKAHFLIAETGYRSEKLPSYTPLRQRNSIAFLYAIYITLRSMLILHCRTMHSVCNIAFDGQIFNVCIPHCSAMQP